MVKLNSRGQVCFVGIQLVSVERELFIVLYVGALEMCWCAESALVR